MPNLLEAKVGGIPILVVVAGGAGAVFLLMLLQKNGKAGAGGNNGAAPLSMLSPTEAEAFGTLQQQQMDVATALGTLGQNTAGLGGQLTSLSGLVTAQTAIQNQRLGAISQQGSDIQAANALGFSDLITRFNSGVSDVLSQGSKTQADIAGVSGQVGGVGQEVAGVGGQVAGVSNQLGASTAAISSGIASNRAASDAYYAALVKNLTDYANAILAQGNSGFGTVESQQAGMATANTSNFQAIQNAIAAITAKLNTPAPAAIVATPVTSAPAPAPYVAPWQPTNTGRTPGASGPGGIWNNPATGHPY